MKKTLTILSVILSSELCISQQIEKTDICPVLYDSYKILRIRNPLAFSPNSKGQNQNWDFSQAVYGSDTFSRYDYMPASSTPYKLDFKGADLAQLATVSYDNSYKAYWYFNDSAASLWEMGSNRGFISFLNSDHENLMPFPLLFQNPKSDQFCYESEAFGSSYTYCGRNHIEFDGFGTLILPYASFTNVKRVFYQSWTANMDTPNDSSRVLRYSWYKSGLHKALLEYNIFLDKNGDTTAISALMLSPSSVNSLLETAEKKMKIYPNPARSYCEIESDLPLEAVLIYSMQGQLLYKAAVSGNRIDLSEIKPGAYILQAGFGDAGYKKELLIVN